MTMHYYPHRLIRVYLDDEEVSICTAEAFVAGNDDLLRGEARDVLTTGEASGGGGAAPIWRTEPAAARDEIACRVSAAAVACYLANLN